MRLTAKKEHNINMVHDISSYTYFDLSTTYSVYRKKLGQLGILQIHQFGFAQKLLMGSEQSAKRELQDYTKGCALISTSSVFKDSGM